MGSIFSVVSIALPWVRAMMLQVFNMMVFHPGSTCNLSCFTNNFPCGTLCPSYTLIPLLLPGVFLHLFLVLAPAFLLAFLTIPEKTEPAKGLRKPLLGWNLAIRPSRDIPC